MDRGDLVTGAFKSTEVGIHGNDTRILLLHSMLFREGGGTRQNNVCHPPPLDGRWAGKIPQIGMLGIKIALSVHTPALSAIGTSSSPQERQNEVML
ncbi:hypothetical protein CDAR_40221 [Caerostris darwini]|uniref:Uncharacterized protein n=1 Tax=Caerostris darwini TaxID=1538125 RepID=A0AAV4RD76_9ARAC|nr:hypothetical protein CDAR_40221 [Caerostris darwini]